MLAVMILNEQDKEALVIDMLNKGHTARQIAKVAHVSFSYIRKIRMKLAGEVDGEQKGVEMKKTTVPVITGLKLFLEGKYIVKVAIMLDLPADQVLKIHSDYLALQSRQDVISILLENRNKPSELVDLLHYLKERHLSLKDVKEIFDIKRGIKNYKLEMDKLDLDTFHAKEFLRYYHQQIEKMKNTYYDLQNRKIL
jgi:hypothetical protein